MKLLGSQSLLALSVLGLVAPMPLHAAGLAHKPAALIAQFSWADTCFILSDYQVMNMIESSCDAALEGSVMGIEYACQIYNREDHSDQTVTQKVKSFRWHYAAVGAIICAALALEGEYLASVLINRIANQYSLDKGN